MPRRRAARPASEAETPSAPPEPEAAPADTDFLVALTDHCTAAQQIADGHGEKFLSYLLAMVLQESALALRRKALETSLPLLPRTRSKRS